MIVTEDERAESHRVDLLNPPSDWSCFINLQLSECKNAEEGSANIYIEDKEERDQRNPKLNMQEQRSRALIKRDRALF